MPRALGVRQGHAGSRRSSLRRPSTHLGVLALGALVLLAWSVAQGSSASGHASPPPTDRGGGPEAVARPTLGLAPALTGDPSTGGWISCATYIACGGGGLAWEIDSTGMGVNGYGYPTSGSDYDLSQAQSDISWELANYGSMMSVISAHYGVPEINMVTETGPETSFGTDGVDDIMQDLSSSVCGGGAGSQVPDAWATNYADTYYGPSCSSAWIHFVSFAAGTNYLLYQSDRYGANFDPGVLGPSYNAGSLVYTTVYSCSGQADAWLLVMCSGGGLTASYSWNIAVAYNAALTQGTTPLSVSYAITDLTTGAGVVCGDTVETGDKLQFTATVSGGTTPYSYAWDYGDGGTGTGNPATHTYTTLGTFNPTLTVTDSSSPPQTATTGAGCDITVTGTPVTFYTDPSNVGDIVVGGVAHTNGQTAIYPLDGAYSLTVTAPGGYIFLGWAPTGGISLGSALVPTTTLVISSTAAATLTVTLATEAPLTFESDPVGDAQAEIAGSSYSSGENASLTVGATYPVVAEPNDGYVFLGWTVVGPGATLASTTASSTTVTIVSTSPTVLTENVRWNAPPAPSDFVVTGSSTTTLSVAWVPPPGTLSGFVLGYAAGTSPPEGSTFQLADIPPTSGAYTVTSLTPGTEYWLELAAVNSTAQGPWTAALPAFTESLPDAPSSLAVEATGTTFARLVWTPPDRGSSVDSYALNCSLGSGTPLPRVTGILPSLTLYNLTGLSPGGTYACSLTSVAGTYVSPPSNTVTFTLPQEFAQLSATGGAFHLSELTSPPGLYALLGLLVVLVLAALVLGLRRGEREPPAPTDGASGDAEVPTTSLDPGVDPEPTTGPPVEERSGREDRSETAPTPRPEEEPQGPTTAPPPAPSPAPSPPPLPRGL